MTWRHSTDSADSACEFCLACGHTESHASWCGPDYLSLERVEVHGASCIPERMRDRPMLGAYRHPDFNGRGHGHPRRFKRPHSPTVTVSGCMTASMLSPPLVRHELMSIVSGFVARRHGSATKCGSTR